MAAGKPAANKVGTKSMAVAKYDACSDFLRRAKEMLREARDLAPAHSFAKSYSRDAISAINSALLDRRMTKSK